MKKYLVPLLLAGFTIAQGSAIAKMTDDGLYDIITIPAYQPSIQQNTKDNVYPVEKAPATTKTFSNGEQNNVKELTIEQTEITPSVKSKKVSKKHAKKPSKKETLKVESIESNLYSPIMNMLGNFKKSVKLIYSDIDEIIVPENDKSLIFRDSVYTTFEKLKENKIPLIFTTGRTFKESKRVALALDINPEYYIVQNGAEILDSDGNIVNLNYLSRKITRMLDLEVKSFNYFYHQDLKIAFYQGGKAYVYRNTKIPDLIDIPEEIGSFSEFKGAYGSSKITVYCSDAHTLDIFKRYLKRAYKNLNIDTESPYTFDITSEQANKANAIEFLSKRLNTSLSNVAAFGVSQCDKNMLLLVREKGGLAISTEDSDTFVKEISSYITKGIDSDGFSFAVDAILGNNKILRTQD